MHVIDGSETKPWQVKDGSVKTNRLHGYGEGRGAPIPSSASSPVRQFAILFSPSTEIVHRPGSFLVLCRSLSLSARRRKKTPFAGLLSLCVKCSHLMESVAGCSRSSAPPHTHVRNIFLLRAFKQESAPIGIPHHFKWMNAPDCDTDSRGYVRESCNYAACTLRAIRNNSTTILLIHPFLWVLRES